MGLGNLWITAYFLASTRPAHGITALRAASLPRPENHRPFRNSPGYQTVNTRKDGDSVDGGGLRRGRHQ